MLSASAKALLGAAQSGIGAALITDLSSGAEWVIEAQTVSPSGEGSCPPAAAAAAIKLIARARSEVFISPEGSRFFIRCLTPLRRLFIVGAVHIALPLEAMARQVDFRVRIIDPRTAFATPERFPEAELDTAWPDEALAAAMLDRHSAVMTLTHDPKLDDAALRVALASPCFYIGCLGGRKTHAARLERLRQDGFDDAILARLHAPIGLDIGAIGAAEIAVAALAQLIQARRGD